MQRADVILESSHQDLLQPAPACLSLALHLGERKSV